MTDVSTVPDLYRAVLAVGSLGTAAFGLVDATKSLNGGISNRGFGDIRKVIAKFIPPTGALTSSGEVTTKEVHPGIGGATSLESVLDTLRANWLNGMSLPDQKAIAKAMIKLNLNPDNAMHMASEAGVDVDLLKNVADKIAKGPMADSTETRLSPSETDVLGRFDLVLSALLDQGYQRGDQRYRNGAKTLAVIFSVALAFIGNSSMGLGYHIGTVLMVGFLATPLAPVAKDVASAIQAGTKAMQGLGK